MEPSLEHLLKDEESKNDVKLIVACEGRRVFRIDIDSSPEHPPD